MKAILVALVALLLVTPLVLSSWNSQELVNNQKFIDEINSKATTWKAGSNDAFAGKTLADIKAIVGFPIMNKGGGDDDVAVSALPRFFDGREAWPSCFHGIRDQKQCGSMAFMAAAVMSDRLCLKSNGTINRVLSPQYIISCNIHQWSCGSGTIATTWEFLKSQGIPTEECYPFTSARGNKGTCKTTCADGSKLKLYKTKVNNDFTGQPAIMTEILANGPVEATFNLYRDFLNYKSGIYQHTSGGGQMIGSIAVKIFGWGVETLTNTPYWMIATSWGEGFGMKGYANVLRKSNHCGIEGDVRAGIVDV